MTDPGSRDSPYKSPLIVFKKVEHPLPGLPSTANSSPGLSIPEKLDSIFNSSFLLFVGLLLRWIIDRNGAESKEPMVP